MKLNQRALTIIGIGLLACVSQLKAQEHPDRCGTASLLELQFKQDPTLKARFDKQNRDLQQIAAARTGNPAARAATILTVPVVFHIVLPNPGLVTDDQIKAQIDTLNKDYAGTNGDTLNIPSYFKSLFGQAGIQFCIARRTPDGQPTTGILRSVTSVAYFTTDDRVKYATSGGDNAWNTSQYLNVWYCQLSGGVLGYSTFPNTGAASAQGVVIDYRSAPGGSMAPYNTGKTLTHEVGHYFNLHHIWGDDAAGSCAGTDYVGDTPNQTDPSYGFFTGLKTDACSPVSPGIMYQNYMDYTNDQCMVMFTAQQVARMLAAATTYRSSLFTSPGCTPVPVKNYNAAVSTIHSPSSRLCTTDFTPRITIVNKGSVTLTSLSIGARIDKGTAVTTNWTGSLATMDSTTITLPGLSSSAGIHSLSVYTGPPNGTADELPADDTLRMNITYYDPLTPSLSESFEGSTYPPQGWDVVNEDGTITWERTSGIAKTGSRAVRIRNYDDANKGSRDYLRLPQMAINDADSAFVTFRVAAGMPASSSPAFITDTLELLVSTDCGASYTSLYKKWGGILSTAQRAVTGAFTPQDDEWRKDSVNLGGYIGKGNLLLAFRNVNGQVSNIYLDDVNVYSKIINPNLKRKGFLITPNPTTNGIINVDFYPNPTNLQGIAVYSASGQLVAQTRMNGGGGVNHYTYNLGGLAAGIYVVKVVYADRVVTQKILKN